MTVERHKSFMKEGHHRGGRYRGVDGSQQHGPKTFRRGRAIAFLERMILKRSTIEQQLGKPEFQSVHQILVGELKAIDMVIDEFIHLFEIHEHEEVGKLVPDSEESLDNGKKGIELNETH